MPDGTRIPVLVGFTLFGEGRRRTAAFVLDLSARKLAEREIRDSESRFKATFDNAAVGIALVARDGHWLQVNDKLCAIVGYTREELLASSFQAITHPADLLTDLALADEVASGVRPHYSLEKRYLRKDGGWAWVNLTVSARRAEDGRFDHFISVVEDISKRHDAEEALQAALSASRTGTYRWNIVTNEIWWDKALRHIFGLPSDTPIASIDDFLQRVHPEHRITPSSSGTQSRSASLDMGRVAATTGTTTGPSGATTGAATATTAGAAAGGLPPGGPGARCPRPAGRPARRRPAPRRTRSWHCRG